MRELDPRRIVLQESRGERSSNGELQTGTGVGDSSGTKMPGRIRRERGRKGEKKKNSIRSEYLNPNPFYQMGCCYRGEEGEREGE